MEKLKYLFANPYAWLFFAFIFTLPYLLKYMRRFYSEELQKKMKKEEVCIMEFQQKPEMKRMRKIVFIGFVLSVSVSYIISYILMDTSCDTTRIFINIFLVLATPIMIYAIVVEYKYDTIDSALTDIFQGVHI